MNKLLYLTALVIVLLVNTASAHDARPVSITMVEQAAGVYRVVVRAPPTLAITDAPTLVWPEHCDILESTPLTQALGSISLINCREGIEGSTIGLQYPNYNPSLSSLFRLEASDGSSQTAILAPSESEWLVPENPGWQQVAEDYTVIGVEHIWKGIDHLLFVAGLLLLARKPKRIVLAITGFTVAHSLTLALAIFGLVSIPVSIVEALIALSIVFLAAEIARKQSNSFSHRYPVLLSFAFGLLHGFGFASVLGEVGLPTSELATGLLFFNVGVELGQLVFIAALVALMMGAKTVFKLIPGEALRSLPWSAVGAYVLGIPACYWFIERSFFAFNL